MSRVPQIHPTDLNPKDGGRWWSTSKTIGGHNIEDLPLVVTIPKTSHRWPRYWRPPTGGHGTEDLPQVATVPKTFHRWPRYLRPPTGGYSTEDLPQVVTVPKTSHRWSRYQRPQCGVKQLFWSHYCTLFKPHIYNIHEDVFCSWILHSLKQLSNHTYLHLCFITPLKPD